MPGFITKTHRTGYWVAVRYHDGRAEVLGPFVSRGRAESIAQSYRAKGGVRQVAVGRQRHADRRRMGV